MNIKSIALDLMSCVFYRELIRHYRKTECRCKSECKSRVTKFQISVRQIPFAVVARGMSRVQSFRNNNILELLDCEAIKTNEVSLVEN